MSGGPSCASIDPSTYSTMRMDHRLRVDDDLDRGRAAPGTGAPPRSVRAPCSSASPNRPRSWRPSTSWDAPPPAAGVTPRICVERPVAERAAARGQDDPADAARAASTSKHWKIALCSESTGSSVAPRRARRRRGSGRPPRPAAPCWRARPCRPPRAPPSPARARRSRRSRAIVQSAPIARGLARPPRARPPPRCRCPASALAQRRQAALVGDHRELRAGADRGGGEPVDVAIGGERDDCGTRSGSRSIRSSVDVPTDPVAPRMVTRLHRQEQRQHHDQRRGRRDRHQPVEPVEHAAMAGQQRARILHPGAALEPALVEIAEPAPAPRAPASRAPDAAAARRSSASAAANEPSASDDAADQPRPGLVRADRRRELGPADRAPGEIGADVARPDQRQRPER